MLSHLTTEFRIGRNVYTSQESTLREAKCHWTAAIMNRAMADAVHKLNEQPVHIVLQPLAMLLTPSELYFIPSACRVRH
jgi:hypothetical protein